MYSIIILVVIIIIIILFIINNINIDHFNNIDNIKMFTKQISIYRPIESSNLKTVKNIVKTELSKYLDVMEHTFTKTIKNNKYNFSNLIGINKKTTSSYVLLGAHIDSPQIDGCESTIDAATSIAIIMELTKTILQKTPDFPLMVVFFDGEEAINGKWDNDNTLSGSRYFVDNFDMNIIDRVYIFDLIGGNLNDNMIGCFKDNMHTINDIRKLYNINLKYTHQIFINPDEYISNVIIKDDHTPFMEKNKYVIDLIPYKFPSTHHTTDDNYTNVNWDYVDIFYKVFYEFMNS